MNERVFCVFGLHLSSKVATLHNLSKRMHNLKKRCYNLGMLINECMQRLLNPS